METKHSPGPWELSAEDPEEILDAHGNTLAKMAGRQKSRANGRLLAAGPTLLQTLIDEHCRVISLTYDGDINGHKKAGCEVCSLVNRLFAFPRF